MTNLRKYGEPPYLITLVHGGPGAAGEMEPVAKKLSHKYGVLEPLQTASSVNGQVEELRSIIEKNSKEPTILVGYSWGALLSILVAAHYPKLVKKLILIGSAPLETHYAADISKTRNERLDQKTQKEITRLSKIYEMSSTPELEKNKIFKQLGLLSYKSDSYAPILHDLNELNLIIDRQIYESVWSEASEMRKNGNFLELIKMIQCPTVVIHGEYDPHPFNGIKKPLEKIIKNNKFIVLEKCGHTPWIEKFSKDMFYKVFEQELP